MKFKVECIDIEGISEKDMWLFTYPTDQELNEVEVTGIFLGYYIPWNGRENASVAKWYGFETYPKIVEGS